MEGTPVKNIEYVVQTALNRLKAQITEVPRLEQIAIEWMTEVVRGTTAFPCVRVAHLKVNGVNQVALPQDFMRYTKIALNHGGRLWTLGLDVNMSLPTVEEAGQLNINQATGPSVETGVYFIDHSWNGVYFPALFAAGGGFNEAYYRIDPTNSFIQLSGSIQGGEIILEYISTGIEVNPATLVPPYYIEPMRNYLIWQMAEFEPQKYPVNAKDRERIYTESMADAAMATGNTIDELLDAYYSAPGLKLR
jgi:hypothetical protein